MDAGQQLIEAVGGGDVAAVRRLLDGGDAQLANTYTEDGWSLLHLASSVEIAALLIEHGADVSARNRHQVIGPGNSPLHAAAYNNRLDVVELLLDRGADVNATDNAGFTPLHLAASNGWVDVVRLLLERGADASARTWNDEPRQYARKTPLELAAPGRVRDDGTPLPEDAARAIARLLRQCGAAA